MQQTGVETRAGCPATGEGPFRSRDPPIAKPGSREEEQHPFNNLKVAIGVRLPATMPALMRAYGRVLEKRERWTERNHATLLMRQSLLNEPFPLGYHR